MKKFLPAVFLVLSLGANAQITIVKADMPIAGDTVRFSNASLQTPVDVSLTGTNYLWDFSALLPVSQGVDTFLTVGSTALIYSLFFNSFGANPANVAQKGQDITGVPQLTVTNLYNFYNKTTALYEQVGIGASLNGITTPVTYGSHDVIYRFPMNYGNVDSSDSNYSLTIPTLGSYAQETHRVNHVDGWGSLITPFGTHNVLRIVSDLTGNDSIYISTLSTGFSTPRPLTREYKWWGSGFEIPLLQINTTVLGTTETVTAIMYRDNFVSNVGLAQVDLPSGSDLVFPNPSDGSTQLWFQSMSNVPVFMSVLDVSGKILLENTCPVQVGENLLSMDAKLPAGTYLINLKQGTASKTVRWVVGK